MKQLWAKGKGIIRQITVLNIPVHAAHAGYFIVLALFPLLVLLVSLLRYTGIAAQALTEMLVGVVPEALLPGAKRLILSTYQSSSGTVISISALAALWSAGRGIYGLRRGLNAIYHTEETRGYFYTRAISAAYTVAFLLVVLLVLFLRLCSDSLLEFLPQTGPIRFFLLLGVQTGLFAVMFMVLPNRRNRLADSLPGAVLASGGWLIFSNLYSVYVEHFGGYTNIYGSVYAVALSMLWLYCCISIVFYGGALNAYLSGKIK